jgi:hypothetical protein
MEVRFTDQMKEEPMLSDRTFNGGKLKTTANETLPSKNPGGQMDNDARFVPGWLVQLLLLR